MTNYYHYIVAYKRFCLSNNNCTYICNFFDTNCHKSKRFNKTQLFVILCIIKCWEQTRIQREGGESGESASPPNSKKPTYNMCVYKI